MMQLAFKKRPRTPWNILICLWTGGPYYHVAAVFKNPNERCMDTVYESTPTTGTHCIIVSYHDPREWDLVDIPMSKEDEEKIQTFFSGELGTAYDWLGLVMLQVFHINRESKDKWICSELVVAGFQWIGRMLGRRACSVSPNKLYKLIKKGS